MACKDDAGNYFEYPPCMTGTLHGQSTLRSVRWVLKYVNTDTHTWSTEDFPWQRRMQKGGYENVAAVYCGG